MEGRREGKGTLFKCHLMKVTLSCLEVEERFNSNIKEL